MFFFFFFFKYNQICSQCKISKAGVFSFMWSLIFLMYVIIRDSTAQPDAFTGINNISGLHIPNHSYHGPAPLSSS